MARKIKQKSLGERIRRHRQDRKMSLQTLANETGYSLEMLEKIEQDQAIPSVAQLLTLGRALDLEGGALLKEEDEEEAVARRKEAVKVRTDHYYYKVLTPEAGHKHLKGFHITIEPHAEHQGASYQHEGEEFHYVLRGQVDVTVGDNVNSLKAGESLHFNSNIQHKLVNPGDELSEILVVLYVP